MGVTSIEWTDRTWNPTRGCSRVSQGCVNCYAERQAVRFANGGPFHGFVHRVNGHPAWTGKVELIESMLDAPLHWKKPSRVFVNSMSDLFHEELSFSDIYRVFDVMRRCPHHTFQILTKRPTVMRAVVTNWTRQFETVLPNVWLGVSCEDFPSWDARVHLLKATPAAKRFISYEPALADLGTVDLEGIDWVIVGGESGPGARPFDVQWARNTVEQCKTSKVACFVKQMGATVIDRTPGPFYQWRNKGAWQSSADPETGGPILEDRKGGEMSAWPLDIRVREFPEARA